MNARRFPLMLSLVMLVLVSWSHHVSGTCHGPPASTDNSNKEEHWPVQLFRPLHRHYLPFYHLPVEWIYDVFQNSKIRGWIRQPVSFHK